MRILIRKQWPLSNEYSTAWAQWNYKNADFCRDNDRTEGGERDGGGGRYRRRAELGAAAELISVELHARPSSHFFAKSYQFVFSNWHGACTSASIIRSVFLARFLFSFSFLSRSFFCSIKFCFDFDLNLWNMKECSAWRLSFYFDCRAILFFKTSYVSLYKCINSVHYCLSAFNYSCSNISTCPMKTWKSEWG